MCFWKMSAYKESEIVTAATEATRRLCYNFRDDQMKVIVAFSRGQDVFVSLPTGSGKNLLQLSTLTFSEKAVPFDCHR